MSYDNHTAQKQNPMRGSTSRSGAPKQKQCVVEVRDVEGVYHRVSAEEVLNVGKEYMCSLFADGQAIQSAKDAKDFVSMMIGSEEREVFYVLWLNSKHRLIEHEALFFGTIDAASVYPREVVKRALEMNAAAVVIAHNHPSGSAMPSVADQRITERLKNALELIDVKLLDHLVVGRECISMAEAGMI